MHRAVEGGGGGGGGGDSEGPTGPRADYSHRHDVHIIHERPVIVPLSEQAAKVRRLTQQKGILQDQMIVLRTMGPDYLAKLERCQLEYMRVTDDMYVISEEGQVSPQCLL
jgi:hypothetical protein